MPQTEDYISCVYCTKERPEACFDCPTCPTSNEDLNKELAEKKSKLRELVFIVTETYRGVLRSPGRTVYILPRIYLKEIHDHFFRCISIKKLPENILGPIRKKVRPDFVFVMTEPDRCPECGDRLEYDNGLTPNCLKCKKPFETPWNKTGEIQEGEI